MRCLGRLSRAEFDQCRYGCVCLSPDKRWLPVKKSTAILTSKRAVQDALSVQCEEDHEHCPLEGAAPGFGSRTKFMENYQPGLVASLACAISIPEPLSVWNLQVQ